MSDLYPLLLLPDFRERVWGARDLSPIYPNYKVEGEPIGEVWLTGDECRVANGPLAGQALGDLAKRFGRELVGEAAPDQHGFPLLVKFLFPREKLSVQVHPDDETARRSGLPHGKSECWYVVATEINAQVGLGLKPGTTRADFESAVRHGGRADALLNWIYIKPGEMIYNPAGTLHCIGPGSVLLEVQQNSDVTYRLYDYGRPRELHLEQGLAAMKDSAGAGNARPAIEQESTSLWAFPHFVVCRGSLGRTPLSNRPGGRTHVVIALAGCGKLSVPGGEALTLAAGDAAVVPAGCPSYLLTPQWEMKYLWVSLGSDLAETRPS